MIGLQELIVDECAVRAIQVADEVPRRLFLDLDMLPRNETQILRDAQIRLDAAPDNDPILFRKRLVSDVANRILEYNFCYYLASDFKYEITIKRPN